MRRMSKNPSLNLCSWNHFLTKMVITMIMDDNEGDDG